MIEQRVGRISQFRKVSLWPQVVLIAALFIASIVMLFWNAFSVVSRDREFKVRTMLREVSERMARAANEKMDVRELSRIAHDELASFPGLEGGFYRSDEAQFVAYSFPTVGPKLPRHAVTNEPPPKERPYIIFQSRQAADLGGEAVVNVLDVGPSRVAIVTRAVSASSSPSLIVWAMFRLTGPDDLNAKIVRYQVSLGLALLGMVVAGLLMLNLGRVLSRQRIEQEQLRDELRRSEQLAVLGKMLAGVAHEIRNPLAGIRSTVELWERLPETANSESSRTAVVQAVDRLNELVTRLLFFAKSPTHDESIDMNRIIQETCNLFAAQAINQSIHVQLDLAPDLPMIVGSDPRLRQVVTNLMTNAFAAMPTGGTLSWTSHPSTGNEGVEFLIRDDGVGISEQTREHLFEPFFTTRAEGTGLGLSLCREIVQQHGGTIDLVSQPGIHGATFRILLPSNSEKARNN